MDAGASQQGGGREDVEALRRENKELQVQVEALRLECNTLRRAMHESFGGGDFLRSNLNLSNLLLSKRCTRDCAMPWLNASRAHGQPRPRRD